MTERLTSSQIEARLGDEIARHPGCQGFQIGVRVCRVERGPPEDWQAEFHATGEIARRDVCEEALVEILADAQADYTLSLDS